MIKRLKLELELVMCFTKKISYAKLHHQKAKINFFSVY